MRESILTRRQVDVCAAYMAGDSPDETAKSLGISRKSVYTHIERARAKMKARTTAHLMAMLGSEVREEKGAG